MPVLASGTELVVTTAVLPLTDWPASKVPPAVVAVIVPRARVVPLPLLVFTKISLAPKPTVTLPSVWLVVPLLLPFI